MKSKKDKALYDIVAWCKEHITRINEKTPDMSNESFLAGERFALLAVITHCEKSLQVENQVKADR